MRQRCACRQSWSGFLTALRFREFHVAGCSSYQFYDGRRHSSSFITTPIFYVNSSPHIGHLYSALLGDAVHRWRKLKSPTNDSIFSTGTDEHGLKIQKASTAAEKDTQIFCNEMSETFKGLFDKAKISYTHFVRTTDEQHRETVSTLWRTLQNNGHIYQGKYEGWYCVADEEYLTESEVRHDEVLGCKVSVLSGRPVEWYTEENYMFKLTHFRNQLLDWLRTSPSPVVPQFSKNKVQAWLKSEDLTDLSISRPSSRLSWGIPVPGDPSQTIYVWLDALANYLTVAGYPSAGHSWPPSEHIIGQDILRFHAIYWPAFLLGAGLALPKRIISHCHWTCAGYKMSKTRGNVVDPRVQFHLFGRESVRYFMMKRGTLHYDGEYCMDSLVSEVNADLANSLGNILGRISAKKLIQNMSQLNLKYSSDLFPFNGKDATSVALATDEDRRFIEELHELSGFVDKCYEDFQIRPAIEAIANCLKKTNKFLNNWAPWNLIKDPQEHATMESVLLIAMETVRLCSTLLLPIIPQHAGTALVRLGFTRTPQPHQLSCLLTEAGVKELEEASISMRKLNLKSKPLFDKLAVPQLSEGGDKESKTSLPDVNQNLQRQ